MSTRVRTTYIAATLIWMGVIFYFSSIPDLRSNLPSFWDFVFRKIAHMVEYGVLFILLSRSMQRSYWSVLIAIVLAISYAFLDEVHQLFVPGRTGSAADILVDAVGVAFAVTITYKTSSRK